MPAQKTERLEARITPETLQQIRSLAHEWGGPVRPLSNADVVTEAIRHCWEAAKKNSEKAKQKT